MHQLFATRAARMKASEIRELLKLLDQPGIISFAGGIPDPALFPAEAFAQAFQQALGADSRAQALQYSVSEGYMPLREWIAGHMRQIGIDCGPDDVLITSGSQQALDYLGKLFLSPGDTALVGWPTYLGALAAFNAYEPRYDRLRAGGNAGAAQYRAAAGSGAVKYAYLSPDFANPTGETVDRKGREALLDLAEELDCALIEDGAYQALRYDGQAIPPILALELARKGDLQACRTIYCGSFSKTLSPGLRVGWGGAARHRAACADETGRRPAFGHHQPDGRAPGGPNLFRQPHPEGARNLPCAPRRDAGGAGSAHARRRALDPARGGHVHLADPAARRGWRATAGPRA